MTASADPLVSRGGRRPVVRLVPQRSRFKCITQELLEATQPQAIALITSMARFLTKKTTTVFSMAARIPLILLLLCAIGFRIWC
jgi:hypothetical protein